jgi:phage terminase small subunit
MAVLADPKREKFAQFVARGLPIIEAYVRAGYKKNSGNATSMRKRPDVAARIEELQKQMREKNQQELTDFMEEFGVNYTYIVKQVLDTAIKAKDAGKYSDAIKGFQEVGKELFSMFGDHSKVTVEKNVTHHNTATVTVQDFTAAFQQLSQAFVGPEIHGTLERVDQPRTLLPLPVIENEPDD